MPIIEVVPHIGQRFCCWLINLSRICISLKPVLKNTQIDMCVCVCKIILLNCKMFLRVSETCYDILNPQKTRNYNAIQNINPPNVLLF